MAGELSSHITLGAVLVVAVAGVVVVVVEKGVVVLVVQTWSAMSVVKLDILPVNVECAVVQADVVVVAVVLQDIVEVQAMDEGELHVLIPFVPFWYECCEFVVHFDVIYFWLLEVWSYCAQILCFRWILYTYGIHW